jgi:hypothetical protein
MNVLHVGLPVPLYINVSGPAKPEGTENTFKWLKKVENTFFS